MNAFPSSKEFRKDFYILNFHWSLLAVIFFIAHLGVLPPLTADQLNWVK